MSRRTSYLLLVTLALFALAAPACAQAPEPPAPPPVLGQGPPPPPPGPPPDHGGRIWMAPGQGAPAPDAMGPGGFFALRVTPEMEAKFLAFMKQMDPASVDDLARLKAQNPRQYLRAISEGIQRMQFLDMLQKKDPAAYQDMVSEVRLEGSTRRLADRYRQASDAQKPAIKERLRALLTQLFNARESNRKREVKRLEKELAHMRTTLQQRARNRTEIVNRKLDDMLVDPSTSW